MLYKWSVFVRCRKRNHLGHTVSPYMQTTAQRSHIANAARFSIFVKIDLKVLFWLLFIVVINILVIKLRYKSVSQTAIYYTYIATCAGSSNIFAPLRLLLNLNLALLSFGAIVNFVLLASYRIWASVGSAHLVFSEAWLFALPIILVFIVFAKVFASVSPPYAFVSAGVSWYPSWFSKSYFVVVIIFIFSSYQTLYSRSASNAQLSHSHSTASCAANTVSETQTVVFIIGNIFFLALTTV